jgi:hypothetical protein
MRRIIRRFTGLFAIHLSGTSLRAKEDALITLITEDPTGRVGVRKLKQMLGGKTIHVTQYVHRVVLPCQNSTLGRESIKTFLRAVDSAESVGIASGFGMFEDEVPIPSQGSI